MVDFGYGLHYTNFSMTAGNTTRGAFTISDLSCDETYQDLCPFTTFTATVENTGSVTSDFVALAFISGEYGPEPYPIKQLVAYERLLQIEGGASATAQFNLTLGSLARYDESGNSIVFPGRYRILIDVPTSASIDFELVGDSLVLDEFPQPPARNTHRD